MLATIGVFSLVMSLSSANIDVPLIMQMPELPTGCEAVSTTMLLNNYGFSIDKSDFTSKYIDYEYHRSEDMYYKYFFGNPFSIYGSYCNPNVCSKAILKYFDELNVKELSPVDLTNKDFDYLLNLVSLDTPIAIWVTIDYIEPSVKNNEFDVTEYYPSHCVVLKGYDNLNGVVYINDPLLGDISKSYTLVKDLYNKMGKRSIGIMRCKND